MGLSLPRLLSMPSSERGSATEDAACWAAANQRKSAQVPCTLQGASCASVVGRCWGGYLRVAARDRDTDRDRDRGGDRDRDRDRDRSRDRDGDQTLCLILLGCALKWKAA